MYRVMNAERTAKVDAPSMLEAAAQFLKIPIRRMCLKFKGDVEPHLSGVRHHLGATRSAMYSVFAEDLHETDERIAIFEIGENL